MDLSYSEDQVALRSLLEKYFSEAYPFSQSLADRALPLPQLPALWSTLASQLAVLGVGLPAQFGGFDGGAVERLIVAEALGSALAIVPYLSSVAGGEALSLAGTPLAGRLIERAIAGDAILAPAFFEPGRRYNAGLPASSVTPAGSGLCLSGTKTLVHDAPFASHFIVTARNGETGALTLLLVDAAAEGVVLQSYRTLDGQPAADVSFTGVSLTPDAILAEAGAAEAMLSRVLDGSRMALAAELVGCVRTAFALTVAYAQERRQFGVPIGSFQALQHRLVNVYLEIERASALLHMAALKRDAGTPDIGFAVAAAMIKVLQVSRAAGPAAVQIHGGMGVSDETPVTHYIRRITALERRLGTLDDYIVRFDRCAGALARAAGPGGAATTGLASFRAEVQAFLQANLSGEMRRLGRLQSGLFAEPEVALPWQRILAQRGWAAPGWPAEYGGPGWTPAQRQIFEEECARASAPVLPAMGLQMCGPVLMRYGSEAQKRRFLPRILSGEDYWCQGYSEPGAGSDLARLALRAERDGDDYVLNGSKLWTTHAQYANWIFLLVRTSTSGKPQAGISFLLAPMALPGITVRPIYLMSGVHEVNQLFFDNVRVPAGNLVGAENQGWEIAKYLLEFERGGGNQVPRLMIDAERLEEMARMLPDDDGNPIWSNASFRGNVRLAQVDAMAVHGMEQRLLSGQTAGQNLGNAAAAMIKISWTETSQVIRRLALDTLGPYGAINAEHPSAGGVPESFPDLTDAAATLPRYLNEYVNTIAGGSSEVLRNILAKVIGM